MDKQIMYNNYDDVRQWVSDQLVEYNSNAYGYSDHNDFIEAITDVLIDDLKDLGFKYGAPLTSEQYDSIDLDIVAGLIEI